MNKDEFIRHIAKTRGCTLVTAAEIVSTFMEGVISAMRENSKLVLVGFGIFQVSNIPARIGYNPHTKQKLEIPASKRVTFKSGVKFKNAVNKKN